MFTNQFPNVVMGPLSQPANRAMLVDKMNARCLFDALKACQANPGPITATTEALYRKKMLHALNSNCLQVVTNIREYMMRNKEARELWVKHGMDEWFCQQEPLSQMPVPPSPGNSSKGDYSDIDDYVAVEAAARSSSVNLAQNLHKPADIRRRPAQQPEGDGVIRQVEMEQRQAPKGVQELGDSKQWMISAVAFLAIVVYSIYSIWTDAADAPEKRDELDDILKTLDAD